MKKFLMIDTNDFWDQFDVKIKKLIESKEKRPEWLRSKDVRELLKISDSTLQSMRISGAIPARKLDHTWFYKYDEIIEALEQGKVKGGRFA